MEKMKNNKLTIMKRLCAGVMALLMLTSLFGCISLDSPSVTEQSTESAAESTIDTTASYDNVSDVPSYSGAPYVILNHNQPYFTEAEYTTTSFEEYGALDSLGRCTQAYACVGKDLMPTEERGSISSVKPTGWQSVKYDIVDGKYLYNRCHLIGWQLTAENANKENLITGTRYLNIEGMLDFENMIADYVKETNNHVLYRVTPHFVGNELVARGVVLEAYSVEDNGEGICFCVYSYNVQPGIVINYADGTSYLLGDAPADTAATTTAAMTTAAPDTSSDTMAYLTYVLNTNTKKFHFHDCGSAKNISAANRAEYTGSRDELIADGYSPCGNCKP